MNSGTHPMKISRFDDVGVAENIIALFRGGNVIPFFGTGFTKGCKSKKTFVPDAAELSKLILKIASDSPNISPLEKSEILEINDLKSAFGLLTDESFVDKKHARILLESKFSAVDFPHDSRRKILELAWPHIFTFNIDDAIERVVHGAYKKVLPNKSVSVEYIQANRCLMKIHGDIEEYLLYEEPNLIFTWIDYIGSLEKNRSMLAYLESIAKRSSFIFIGCSLDAEIDLLHISSKTQFSNSIFLKRGPPTVKERIALQSYGIGQVIYFDDYETIYEWLHQHLSSVEVETRNPELIFLNSPKSKNDIVRYIASGGPIVHKDDKKQVTIHSPDFISDRDIVQTIRNALIEFEYVIVRGKRFSGKTTALLQLYKDLSHFNGNFFASQETFRPAVRNLVAGVENSLFIFDSNFFDGASLSEILNTKLAKGSKLVFCCNNSEYTFFLNRLEEKSIIFKDIEIKNSLIPKEAKFVNSILGKLGLPDFKEKENLLNSAFTYFENYQDVISKSKFFTKTVDKNVFQILFVIAAFGKVSRIAMDAAFPLLDLRKLSVEYDALFEVEGTRLEEVLICNSRLWLMNATRKFINENKHPAAIYVAELIISLRKGGANSAASALLRLDKLNEVVSDEGGAYFIREVYAALKDAYELVPHYWLQLAKLELITAKKLSGIEDGISHAKKVRIDLSSNKDTTYFSATLTLAQLCGRKFIETHNDLSLVEMLRYYTESFDNYDNNKRHLDSIVEQYRERRHVYRSLNALFTTNSLDLLPYKQEIDTLRVNMMVDVTNNARLGALLTKKKTRPR